MNPMEAVPAEPHVGAVTEEPHVGAVTAEPYVRAITAEPHVGAVPGEPPHLMEFPNHPAPAHPAEAFQQLDLLQSHDASFSVDAFPDLSEIALQGPASPLAPPTPEILEEEHKSRAQLQVWAVLFLVFLSNLGIKSWGGCRTGLHIPCTVLKAFCAVLVALSGPTRRQNILTHLDSP